MSRIVFCRKYQAELPGLAIPPMPGTKGQELFDTISKKAWDEWLQLQTMLINEKRLNLFSLNDKTYLEDQREKFFNNEDTDRAEGYVPPKAE